MTIYLIPIGMPRHEIFQRLARGLARSFSADVAIEAKRSIPEEAYDFRRSQYYANAILDDLAGEFIIRAKEERVLGVIDADMHTDPMNFIFGLANRKAGCCLISLARLKPEFYGEKPDKELLASRAIKESMHELGHTFRLSHCPRHDCAMFFCESVQATDKKKAGFCSDCKKKLRVLK
jgi:archaemetzincin